jgi:serine/threonine-protein kinase
LALRQGKDVQVGQLIAGKYRIERMLGRGGMGVVMAALHEQLNQRVALKFLTDDAYQQPEAVARFVREARAAVQIQSEHVARVLDVGTLDNGAPYMVMEHLRGRDLKEVSERRGPMPVSEAVDYLLQACDAVAEAHSLGIVHRDLKPSNLFLTERPDHSPLVKVLDFGISKALHGGDSSSQLHMTATAAIMGSPQYMSPEQIRSSKSVDARADVWALGTILYEFLTGGPPYVADTVPGLLAMIVADPPPPLCASRPDAPPELEAVILRCLEKNRDQRFASVAALARALERFASAESKPLVRRIARILGDDAAPDTELAPIAAGITVNESAAPTEGTWARTGRLLDALAHPSFYTRPDVQVGAGVGVVALVALLWLFSASSSDSSDAEALQTNATGTTPQVAAPPAAPQAPADAVTVVRSLTPVAVRPATLPVAPAPTAAPVAAEVHPLAETPRAAAVGSSPVSRKEADAAAAASRAAKKPSAGPAPKRRPPAPPGKPGKPSSPETPVAASPPPAEPAKKVDPLEGLFDQTK